jgi:hypothetical protein
MPAPAEIERISNKLSDYPHQLTTEESVAILLYHAMEMREWCDGVAKYLAAGGNVAPPPAPPKWPPA